MTGSVIMLMFLAMSHHHDFVTANLFDCFVVESAWEREFFLLYPSVVGASNTWRLFALPSNLPLLDM